MKLAILSPKAYDNAETFIKNHIDHLPFDTLVVYEGNYPYLTREDQPTTWEGVRFNVLNTMKRLLGFKTERFNAFYLRKILKRHSVDAVLSEYLIPGAEALEVCKELKLPLSAIALGYDISQYDILQSYSDKYRALFQYAKAVFIVSNHMKDNLKTFDCPDDKIVYSPIGPADDFFDINPKFDKKQLLAIGRFVDKKAPHLTIEAFFEVLKKHPDAILIMAGDGPLLDHCKDLVKSLNIEDAVKFVGRIDQEEQKRLLESSYMFVQHSRIAKNGDSEGTPVAILEASAAGLPVVSTFHAGIASVVVNEKSGYLVPENDINLMSIRIIDLLDNINLNRNFGAHGKTFVKDNFSLNKHIEIISNSIRKV